MSRFTPTKISIQKSHHDAMGEERMSPPNFKMANYKRKHKMPRSTKCHICMSKKLAHGKYSDKEKKLIKFAKDEVINTKT